jgi:hypothetical protein
VREFAESERVDAQRLNRWRSVIGEGAPDIRGGHATDREESRQDRASC